MSLVRHHDDEHCSIATWRHAALAVWRRDTHPGAVVTLKQCVVSLGQAHPSGIIMLQLVQPSASIPSAEARNELAAMLVAARPVAKSSALVYAADGFTGASVRAIVSGLALLAKASFPHRVFPNVQEAVEFHIRNLRGAASIEARDLLAAVDELADVQT